MGHGNIGFLWEEYVLRSFSFLWLVSSVKSVLLQRRSEKSVGLRRALYLVLYATVDKCLLFDISEQEYLYTGLCPCLRIAAIDLHLVGRRG